MSNDNGLEPGWLNTEIDSTNREVRNRAIADIWTRMRNERPATNPYLAAEEYLARMAQFGIVVAPPPDGASVRSFEVELRNVTPRIIPANSLVHVQVHPTEPQDNRCMDTVARSMTNEARILDVRHVEDIPFGEYGFTFRNEEVRVIVSCRTIEGDERLVHVVWGGSSCLGIITIRHNRLTVRCRYQDASINIRDLKIISQPSDTPPVPTSHVRRVEL